MKNLAVDNISPTNQKHKSYIMKYEIIVDGLPNFELCIQTIMKPRQI